MVVHHIYDIDTIWHCIRVKYDSDWLICWNEKKKSQIYKTLCFILQPVPFFCYVLWGRAFSSLFFVSVNNGKTEDLWLLCVIFTTVEIFIAWQFALVAVAAQNWVVLTVSEVDPVAGVEQTTFSPPNAIDLEVVGVTWRDGIGITCVGSIFCASQDRTFTVRIATVQPLCLVAPGSQSYLGSTSDLPCVGIFRYNNLKLIINCIAITKRMAFFCYASQYALHSLSSVFQT